MLPLGRVGRASIGNLAALLVAAGIACARADGEEQGDAGGAGAAWGGDIWIPADGDADPAEPGAAGGRFAVRVDAAALDRLLATASTVDGVGAEIPLPMPDGTFVRFRIEPSPTARSPSVRAFRGRSPNAGLSARIERTPVGVHAVVTGPPGDLFFVDPDLDSGPGGHVAYRARDADRPLVDGGGLPLVAVRRIEAAMAAKARRTPAQRKIGSQLLDAARDGSPAPALDADAGGRVLVDITAEVSPSLLARIVALGGTVVDSVARYRAVRARLAPEALEALAADEAVDRIEPADIAVSNRDAVERRDRFGAGREPMAVGSLGIGQPVPHGMVRSASGNVVVPRRPRDGTDYADAPGTTVGHPPDNATVRARSAGGSQAAKENTSEADAAHAAADARERFGVDGTGIGIGVLSDGIGTLVDRQVTGDLPASVTVLPGQAGVEGHREGTAMLEIVHDLAPGAHLYFATVFSGQARFAANIEALCAAGADVIVDDVSYLSEGAFQDDIVARGINAAAALGCFHFSAAGNSGNLDAATAGVWEGDFAPAEGDPPAGVEGVVHDFGDAGSNRIEKRGFEPQLKWADPLGASANDYDLYLFDGTLTELLASSTTSQTGKGHPYEWIPSHSVDVGSRLVVVKASGEGRYLRLDTPRGRLELATAGQIFGHYGAKSVITAAAVDARAAGSAEGVFDGTEQVEDFSSDGPRRMFFEPDRTPVTPGNFGADGGELVAKPDIAAADGVSTATPGFGDFHGTSAAAAHAAAIAALVLQAAGGPKRVTPAELRAALAEGALDIGAEGADRNAGAGIMMAPAAVEALDSGEVHRAPTVTEAIADRTLIALADQETLDLDGHFHDADGDPLTYSLLLDDAAIAGAEIAGSTLSLAPGPRGKTTVTVRATDPGGLSALTTFAVTVDREWGQTDYDVDDDGLIEVANLEQLDAMRHDLDGDSVEDAPEAGPLYYGAFADAARDMGCATGCTGFELTRNLDFEDPSSYASGGVDRGWSVAEGGPGWTPIGTLASADPLSGRYFDADFLGNSHAIANLFIDRPERDGVGLFGLVGGTSAPNKTIGGVVLVGADVTGRDYVGALVGAHDEYRPVAIATAEYWIRAVDIRGVGVRGRVSGKDVVGGLAGLGGARIVGSFAAVRVSGERRVGGLVGETGGNYLYDFGTISASYATGPVSGHAHVGGLVGSNLGAIAACYATGGVDGTLEVGGLVGSVYGPVSSSYATGRVGGEMRGGLFGFVNPGVPLRANYWDLETSGTRVGAGSDDRDRSRLVDGDERPSVGGRGMTTGELTAPRGYDGPYANWNLDLDRDTAVGPDAIRTILGTSATGGSTRCCVRAPERGGASSAASSGSGRCCRSPRRRAA